METIDEILSLYSLSSTKSRKNVKIFNTIFKLINTRELRDSESTTFQNPTLYEIVDEARVDAFVRNFFVLFRTHSFTINSTFIRTAGIGIRGEDSQSVRYVYVVSVFSRDRYDDCV